MEITKDLYVELLVTLRELNNYRYKAKDSVKVSYWEGEIAKVKKLIKQYEEQINTSNDVIDSVDGLDHTESLSSE